MNSYYFLAPLTRYYEDDPDWDWYEVPIQEREGFSLYEQDGEFFIRNMKEQSIGPFPSEISAKLAIFASLGETRHGLAWISGRPIESPPAKKDISHSSLEKSVEKYFQTHKLPAPHYRKSIARCIKSILKDFPIKKYRYLNTEEHLRHMILKLTMSDLRWITYWVFERKLSRLRISDKLTPKQEDELLKIFYNMTDEECEGFYPAMQDKRIETQTAIEKAIDANPDALGKILSGNDKPFNFLFGQAMKELKGQGDPLIVKDQLRRAIDGRKT